MDGRIFDNHLTDGEQVAAAARMVGDTEDFSTWRSTRRRWTRETVQALREASFEDPVVTQFERVTNTSPGCGVWGHDLQQELERVHDGLNLLKLLAANGRLR
jgi:hypothetical protein